MHQQRKPPPHLTFWAREGVEGVNRGNTPSVSRFKQGRGWWWCVDRGNIPSVSCFEQGRGWKQQNDEETFSLSCWFCGVVSKVGDIHNQLTSCDGCDSVSKWKNLINLHKNMHLQFFYTNYAKCSPWDLLRNRFYTSPYNNLRKMWLFGSVFGQILHICHIKSNIQAERDYGPQIPCCSYSHIKSTKCFWGATSKKAEERTKGFNNRKGE